MSWNPSMEVTMDLIKLSECATFSDLKEITASSLACLFFIHLCIVVGLQVTLVLQLLFLKGSGIFLVIIDIVKSSRYW